MERVLVTGASGFVGTQVLKCLQGQASEIHVLGRTRQSRSDARWHVMDLLHDDPSPLLREIEATHLIHLGWVTAPGNYLTDPLNTSWLRASEALIRAFADAGGSHIVSAGTCLEYDLSGGRCIEDHTPLNPMSPYARAKCELHSIARGFLEGYSTTLSWARIFHLYGPGEDSERLVAHVITSLINDQEAHVSAGLQRRDYLYVEDAAAALVSLLQSGFDGAVNIGSGHAVAVREMARMAAAAVGKEELLHIGANPTKAEEAAVIEADVTRIRSAAGWTPETPPRKGLRLAVEWWRDHLAGRD